LGWLPPLISIRTTKNAGTVLNAAFHQNTALRPDVKTASPVPPLISIPISKLAVTVLNAAFH
jgi:hypothetical protein